MDPALACTGLRTALPPDSPVVSPEPRLLAGGRGSLFIGKESPAGRGAKRLGHRIESILPVLICGEDCPNWDSVAGARCRAPRAYPAVG
jgi:hypothetical protein